jgi:hypothetical protein
MNKGYLSQFFKGVAVKKLSQVEANPAKSNQHEFNGAADLKTLLGNVGRKFPTKCVYLNDMDDDPMFEDTSLTWYDARANHPTRTEWRLYFKPTQVSSSATAGDTLLIARNLDDTLLMIIAEQDSTIEKQILWLFGLSESSSPVFAVKSTLENEQDRLRFASDLILEKIGITPHDENTNLLDVMLTKFGGVFPATNVFSDFVRGTLPSITARDNPDEALLRWMTQEETLFRTLEKHIIADRLQQGFADDVDDFIRFSLSVHNRRKARAGMAFENHIQFIFNEHKIRHSRTPMTEDKKRPDFLFPGATFYHDAAFPTKLLTMLGVKTTSKDRWRQVCTEADRISPKHLLTLEPSISTNQTDEMRSSCIQLVVPEEIKATYTDAQQAEIMNFRDFIGLVSEKQIAAGLS